MRYLWTSLILALMVAGCAPTGATVPLTPAPTVASATLALTASPVTPTAQPAATALNTTPLQTAGATTTPAVAPAATTVPTTEATATAPRTPTSAPASSSGAASSTRVPQAAQNTVTPAPAPQGTRAGDKAFANSAWHIAFDYPSGWTVSEDANGATFKAPNGTTIRLSLPATKSTTFPPDNDLPNTRCSLQTNAYGIQERVCLDTIARSYIADILVPTQGVFTLSMRLPGDTGAFDSILASIHPAS